MRSLFSAGVALVFGLAAVSTASAANIVLNGDFETGTFSNWTQGGNIDGSSLVTNANPNSGTYSAGLGAAGHTSFTLDQTLAVDPSSVYNLTFYLAQGFDPDPGNGILNFFSASFDGTQVLSETNVAASGYQTLSYMITTGAADTSAVLDFQAYNDADYFYLDDVSVTEATGNSTPEPGSIFLGVSGILATVAVLRRRKSA